LKLVDDVLASFFNGGFLGVFRLLCCEQFTPGKLNATVWAIQMITVVWHVDLEVLFAARSITCATNEASGVRWDRDFESSISRHQSILDKLTRK